MANLFRVKIAYKDKSLKHMNSDETRTLEEIVKMWPFFKIAFTHPELVYIEWQVGASGDKHECKVRIERIKDD